LFSFEDAVVDNLFIVLQGRWHRYECKMLNVKSVVKYCNDLGKKLQNIECIMNMFQFLHLSQRSSTFYFNRPLQELFHDFRVD